MDKIVQNRQQYRIRAISCGGIHVRAAGSTRPEAVPVTCPECRSETMPGAAFCGYCGTRQGGDPPGEAGQAGRPASPGASVSQFPRTPGDQYVANAGPGQHAPPPPAPPREFRLDLRRLSRADQTVGGASLIVLVSLFLPWFGFGTLGTNISIAGTTAHGYLVIVVITALLMAGYLLLRSGWDAFPVRLPVGHETLLLAGTGVQFLLVLIGFLNVPLAGLGREIGAYLALLASAGAVVPVARPVLRSWPGRR
jgi:hypothetical protein